MIEFILTAEDACRGGKRIASLRAHRVDLFFARYKAPERIWKYWTPPLAYLMEIGGAAEPIRITKKLLREGALAAYADTDYYRAVMGTLEGQQE